jgi:hypothetical protein
MHVELGGFLQLVKVNVIACDGIELEEAIKVDKVEDNKDKCIISVIPQDFAPLERIYNNIDSCCIVLELYDNSNRYKQLKSERNAGKP